jgi:bifunctional non-homologous end joining protein LigD
MTAARAVRDRLTDLDLPALLKTTGGKGRHVVVPLARRYDWQQVQTFGRAFAEEMAHQDSAHYTARMAKAARGLECTRAPRVPRARENLTAEWFWQTR